MTPLRLALVGHPVAHSRSPHIQQVFAAATGVALDYALADVPPAALPAWLATVDLDGFNVTAPHKAAVFAWVEATTPVAGRLGAVNTVVRRDGTWVGHNTDLIGFTTLFSTDPGRSALVVGAGGAARAVVAALGDLGIEVAVAARRPAQAEALLAALAVRGEALSWAAVPDRLADFERVVECTGAAAAVALPWARLADSAAVFALAYGAGAAPLLAAVRAAGRVAVDGLPMLVAQGRAAFEAWTGRTVPEPAVLAALAAARDV